jgi:transposase-like protein
MGTKSISAEAKWRRIIQEQVDSGQTVAQFCRNSSIASSSLFAWKRRLIRRVGASAFVEATLQRGDEAGGESRPGIEIHLRRERRIVVRPGFDQAMLSEVVRALEASA